MITVPDLSEMESERGDTMRLSDLVEYAWNQYRIPLDDGMERIRGYSLLIHPETGRWLAVLMRTQDSRTGEIQELADIRCGMGNGTRSPYLSLPYRMQGREWVGVRFHQDLEQSVVFGLFDQAAGYGDPRGYTVVLHKERPQEGQWYRDSPLPRRSSEDLSGPRRIQEMKRRFSTISWDRTRRIQAFLKQADFMKDYEDDHLCSAMPAAFPPLYQDLSVNELRGYFTWRSGIFHKEYIPGHPTFVFLYASELLNGIHTDSVKETFQKLQELYAYFLKDESGPGMRQKVLRRWCFEYAIVNNVPPMDAVLFQDPETAETDHNLAVLKNPQEYSDQEVFDALTGLVKGRFASSPVLNCSQGMRLFAEGWRKAVSDTGKGKENLFERIFGRCISYAWRPLGSAACLHRGQAENRTYELNLCRKFICENGSWIMQCYESRKFNLSLLKSLLAAFDRKFRIYLNTGRRMKRREEDAWAEVFADEAIAQDQKELKKASVENIRIDRGGLDQIRSDALKTLDSLLSEEEKKEMASLLEEEKPVEQESAPDEAENGLLDEIQMEILRALLDGQPAEPILKRVHLLPSLAADAINEALMDEIGDTAVQCENDTLSLVEDYREEIAALTGGNRND